MRMRCSASAELLRFLRKVDSASGCIFGGPVPNFCATRFTSSQHTIGNSNWADAYYKAAIQEWCRHRRCEIN